MGFEVPVTPVKAARRVVPSVGFLCSLGDELCDFLTVGDENGGEGKLKAPNSVECAAKCGLPLQLHLRGIISPLLDEPRFPVFNGPKEVPIELRVLLHQVVNAPVRSGKEQPIILVIFHRLRDEQSDSVSNHCIRVANVLHTCLLCFHVLVIIKADGSLRKVVVHWGVQHALHQPFPVQTRCSIPLAKKLLCGKEARRPELKFIGV
mmetsp:Transcript_12404/g.24077  ORF Transcript_12404/g.24077 Transcript_12404/m.24077 type:complete len:206 (-) Transcript_12404:196-813(-)